MSSLLGTVDYLVIGFMLAVSACVGLFFRFTGGRQKTTHEFLMAGKNMSIGPVAFSLMATYLSAISVLGIPAETYKYGTQRLIAVAGMPFGAAIAGYGLLPVFFQMEVSTVYEYLERRFGKTTRTVASLLFVLQMIFYMAVVLYAPALALNAVTGLSTWVSVLSLTLVCTFYCSLGGLKAVLWTDVFQSLLMYTTISAVVIKGAIDMGGLGTVMDIAKDGGRLIFLNTSLDPTERYTLWNALTFGIFSSISQFGTNQAEIQRMLSLGNLKKAQWSIIWSLPLITIFNLFCYWDGVVIFSYFHDCDPLKQSTDKLSSADRLLPYAVLKMFGSIPGLTGLCIAGVFSASLSTISSAVNSLTAVTMEDFIRPFCFCKSLTESWAVFIAKLIAIAYGGVCLFLTYIVSNFRGVLEAAIVLLGMVGGPMTGMYFLGMFTTTANEPGTLIGLAAGFAVNAWLGFGSYVAKVPIPSLPTSVDGCIAPTNTTFSPFSLSEATATSITVNNLFDAAMGNMTDYSFSNEEERYILPVYKISYLLLSFIGACSVFVVGYMASFFIGLFKRYPSTPAESYSPFVRQWYCPSSSPPDNIRPHLP